ncbi:hypothetical protein [Sphingomonas hankookensis]|uniref:hypothetical protein n=1 Tax=Sphingomonas hankookensis TaxID=563996 RepID=UPI003F7AABC9
MSVLSATQSAATFLGGPDYGYGADLTYLTGTVGGLLGAMFVAHVMIPRFYAIRATTAYELLTMRFGIRATRWAGGMFLIGRVFAGGRGSIWRRSRWRWSSPARSMRPASWWPPRCW